MDLTNKAKEEIENRLKSIEQFIEDKGLGANYLNKAKKTQRNLNLALLAGGALVIAGLTMWAVGGSDEE